MLNYKAVSMRYEPYPLAVLRPAIEPELYSRLVDSYPPIELFGKLQKYDYKLSLSEKYNPRQYHTFIATTPIWKQFHDWLKSEDFIRRTIEFLKLQNVDLGIDEAVDPLKRRFALAARALIRRRPYTWPLKLRSRFEFSVLKADGGEVAPHTDTPKKIITFVITMTKEDNWPLEYGGGLDINRANDSAYAFNMNNRIVPWDKIEVLDTIPFIPNQCTIFVKTFNSLHSVRKMMQKGSEALRKTVTIVIEHDE